MCVKVPYRYDMDNFLVLPLKEDRGHVNTNMIWSRCSPRSNVEQH